VLALVGPSAWSLHLLVSYALAAVACQTAFPGFSLLGFTGISVLLTLVTLLTALAALVAGVLSFRRWRRAGDDLLKRADEPRGFMAGSTVRLNLVFLAAVLLAGIPLLIVPPCT
jgi:hypothetical protein